MEVWKSYRLGDLVRIYSGGTPNKTKGCYWNGDIPWISAKSMYDDFIESSDLCISESGLLNGSKLARKGTILLLTRGSGLFNRIPVCWTRRDLAYNQDVKNIVSKDENIVSTEYLFYWLYGNKNTIASILETTGIGAGKIDTERLLNLDVLIPKLETQEQILKMVKPLFDKINLNSRINHNLEEQAQALYKSWFIDFEPFKDGKFVDSELGMIPEGWRIGKISDIATVTSGKRPNVKYESSSAEHAIPVFGASSVMAFTDSVYLKEQAIITGRVGTLGILQRVDFPCWPSDNTLIIQSPYENFVYQELREVDYSSLNRGSTQPLLTQSDLKSWSIIIPPKEIIAEYESLIRDNTDLIAEHCVQNQRLSLLRDTLLPQLMSGQLTC